MRKEVVCPLVGTSLLPRQSRDSSLSPLIGGLGPTEEIQILHGTKRSKWDGGDAVGSKIDCELKFCNKVHKRWGEIRYLEYW